MHEPIAKQWIAALRSGKYAQATGALRTSDGFCCLGVLCDLNGVKWTLDEGDGSFIALGATEILPLSIQEWAGLNSNSGIIPFREVAGRDHELSALNDNGKTFSEIADIIEAHWAEL